MHSFQWVQGALGVIVALGMTRLAVSVAHMFVARGKVRMDWVPFAWAVSIFFLLLQFSWNFVGLETVVKSWTFPLFLSLLLFVFNLFIAAALILPNTDSQAGEDMQAFYAAHGRWAMPFIAVYALMAYPVNWYFAHMSPLDNPASAVITALAMTAFFAKSRKILTGATALNLLGTGALVVEMAMKG